MAIDRLDDQVSASSSQKQLWVLMLVKDGTQGTHLLRRGRSPRMRFSRTVSAMSSALCPAASFLHEREGGCTEWTGKSVLGTLCQQLACWSSCSGSLPRLEHTCAGISIWQPKGQAVASDDPQCFLSSPAPVATLLAASFQAPLSRACLLNTPQKVQLPLVPIWATILSIVQPYSSSYDSTVSGSPYCTCVCRFCHQQLHL